MGRTHARFIWSGPTGQGRNRYVLFRRSFELADEPEEGLLHIFADTRYRLMVNGAIVAHGPARFFVCRPEYDTHDVAALLRRGLNVVAVVVNSYGCYSFHSESSIGGLIAWGEVRDAAGNEVDLSTGPEWKALDCPARRRDTSKLSFALNPGELLDARRSPTGWARAGFDDSDWPRAVAVDAQEHWGELQPRSIPLLDEAEQTPEGRLGAWHARWADEEARYSFVLTAAETTHGAGPLAGLGMAFLHSPRRQDVTIGAFWGRYWLNGRQLTPRRREDISLRQDFEATLQEGWNAFQVLEQLHYGSWEFYLGLPVEAGVTVSAEPDADCPNSFLLAGPWPGDLDGTAEALGLPLDAPDELPPERRPWKPWHRDMSADSAYVERCWRTFEPIPERDPGLAVDGKQFAQEVGDGALSLLYDFGGEMLGRPLLEFTAEEGTTVDLTYSERLREGLPADHGQHHVRMAERYIARAGRQEWRTFHPRGFRYLEVLVQGDLSGFELHRVAMTRANYPVECGGSFECSDPLLNRIWEVGRASLHACMEDAYLDCPRRERGLYAGDALVQFFTNLATFGDRALMRRCVELFFLSQDESGLLAPGAHGLRPGRHPDYSAIMAQALWQYYHWSGDAAFLREMGPRLRRLLAGLADLRAEGTDLLDGSDLRPYLDRQRMDRGGINCALNCFYQRAFADGARIAQVLGNEDAASRYRARAESLASAIRREFWDPDGEVFVDRRREDAPETGPSVAANSLPLLYDIAGEGQVAGALDYLTEALLDNFRGTEPARDHDC
ncbi:MAG: family 78 glycoside hydrolase catalytic domain, partial [Candidatus Brocadiaceae bacterium]